MVASFNAEPTPPEAKKFHEMTVEERKLWFQRWMEVAERNRAASPPMTEEEIEQLIQSYRYGG